MRSDCFVQKACGRLQLPSPREMDFRVVHTCPFSSLPSHLRGSLNLSKWQRDQAMRSLIQEQRGNYAVGTVTRLCQIARVALLASCVFAVALRLAVALPAQEQSAKPAAGANSASSSSDVRNGDASAAKNPASTSKSSEAEKAAEDTASAALAPVVYNDDETPGARGFHYTFFGNAFFINEDGYLLTVAHVMETFRDGGQPYILVSRPNAPPRLVKVSIIASDPQHDVAILRATPNPFASNANVAFVPLSSGQAARGETVLALSVHPKQLQNAHSFELQREDFSPGTVIAFESTQLAKPGPPADVFLLSHPVVKGQSGSPVLDAETHAAVGLIEGIWLRGSSAAVHKTSAQSADVPGAAIPMRYALALLKQNNVAWHAAGPAASTSPPSSVN